MLKYYRLFCIVALLLMVVPASLFASNGKIPIYQPTTITNPGSYYLTADLPLIFPAIVIDASYVTLDLQGHTVNGTIMTQAPQYNIRITNGKVEGGGIIDLSLGGGFFRVDNLQIDTGFITIGPGSHMIVEHNSTDHIFYSQVTNGIIAHNTLTSSEMMIGIDLVECMNIEVIYNTSHKNGGEGIHLGISSNCIVSYNDACENIFNGFTMDDSHNNSIMHNNFSQNQMNGIMAINCKNNIIAYNNCSGNDSFGMGFANGIFLESCDANDVSNNNTSGNEVDGICLGNSSNHKIAHNTSSSNMQNGINLINMSMNNSLDWNHAANNSIGFNFDNTTGQHIYSNNRAPGNAFAGYQDLGVNTPVVYGVGFPTNF